MHIFIVVAQTSHEGKPVVSVKHPSDNARRRGRYIVAEEPLNDIIARMMKNCRKARQWSLERMAKKIGVSYQQIQKYECAQSQLSLPMFLRFCKALEINPEKFLQSLKKEARKKPSRFSL